MFRISYDDFWKRMNEFQQQQTQDGRTYSIERAFTDFGYSLVRRLSNDAIARLIDEHGHRTDLTNRTFRARLVAERERRKSNMQTAILILAGATLLATCVGIAVAISVSTP